MGRIARALTPRCQVSSSPLGCCGDSKRKNGKLLFGGAVEVFSILRVRGFGAVGSKKMEF